MGRVESINAVLAPRPRAGGLSLWADRHFKWLLVAPAAVLILALTIYPLIYSVWVAFVNFDFQIPGMPSWGCRISSTWSKIRLPAGRC
jgi:multiple sugar transport system permease protein